MQFIKDRKNTQYFLSFPLILGFISFLPYYPPNFRILFFTGFIGFLLLFFINKKISYFFIFLSLPFFGNHPGGRFMEILDYLIFSLGILNFDSIYSLKNKKNFFLLVALLFLPILLNIPLLKDFQHYKINLYFFWKSSELEVFYPIKQIFILFSIILIILSILKNRFYLNYSLIGFFAGFIFSICLGYLEVISVKVSNYLDYYHIWLGGYLNKAPSHIPWLSEKSPNSLFWNRSWYSIYLISGYGLILLFFQYNKLKRIYFVIFNILLIGILFFIGSRGGILSIIIILSLIFLPKNLKTKKLIIPSFIISFFIYNLITVSPINFFDLSRKEHLISGLITFLDSPFIGYGFESYGWVNENILRKLIYHSRFHSAHSQYINILAGTGILGMIIYIRIIIISLTKSFSIISPYYKKLLNYALLGILTYQLMQEWFYIRAAQIPFIFLIIYFFRKESIFPHIFLKKDKYLISALIFIFSILSIRTKPILFYGVYFNPIHNDKAYYLEGEIYPDFHMLTTLGPNTNNDLVTIIQKGDKFYCKRKIEEKPKPLIESLFSKETLDSEARKICIEIPYIIKPE